MKKPITSNFLKTFNLFIKSVNLNKSIIGNQKRRQIIKGLVDLGLINHKEPTDILVAKLYTIKERLIKQLESQIKKESLLKYKNKITKKTVTTIDNKKDIVFKTITIKEKGNRITSFHSPKQIKKNIKKEKIINIVKDKTVKVKDNYTRGDLLQFIDKDKIHNIFRTLNEII